MGQKVHPIGFRLGVNRSWNSIWYSNINKKNYLINLHEDFKIRKYIKGKVKFLGYLNSLIKIYRNKENLLLITSNCVKGIKLLRKKFGRKLSSYINFNKFLKINIKYKRFSDKYLRLYKTRFKFKKHKKKDKIKSLRKFFRKRRIKNFRKKLKRIRLRKIFKKSLKIKLLEKKKIIKNLKKKLIEFKKLNLGLKLLKNIKKNRIKKYEKK